MPKDMPELAFDRGEQILFVGLSGLKLQSESQVKRVFDAIHRFWVRECNGKKAYAVIDYTNFSLDIGLTDIFAACVKQAVTTYSITTVRFTADVSVRATLRAVAVKTHQPSNLYATRDDAIAVVRALRAQKILLEAS